MAAVLPALRDVKLDDKYELESGRVYLTGAQAFVRLLILQRQRDKLAGPQHRRLRLRLPRLAARRARPVAVEGAEVPRARERQVPAGPQRGPRGDVDLGHAAGQPASAAPRSTACSRCGTARVRAWTAAATCSSTRNFAGTVEARRRARAGRRRPRGQVVDAAAPVRAPVLGGDDPGAVSVVGAGDPRPRPARLGDVALLGLLGRLQVRRRHGRELGSSVYIDPVAHARSSCPTTFRCRRTACRSAGPTRSSPPKRACRTTRSTPRCTTAASTSSTASSSIRPRPRLGIVTSGKSYLDVRQALDDLGIDEQRRRRDRHSRATRSRCRGRSSRKACATSPKASRRSSSSRRSGRSSSTS